MGIWTMIIVYAAAFEAAGILAIPMRRNLDEQHASMRVVYD
jgi:hypothetical protein